MIPLTHPIILMWSTLLITIILITLRHNTTKHSQTTRFPTNTHTPTQGG